MNIATHFMRTAGLSLAAAAVALCGMMACTNDDNITGDEPATEQPAAVTTYQVSIPASFGGDAQTRAVEFDADGSTSTTTFETTDNIYVYDETQDLWAFNSSLEYVPLKPEANAKTTQLTGTLSFYNAVSMEPAVDDVIRLFYNISPNGTTSGYYYTSQNGTAASASARDFAEATMKIKAISGNATDGYTLTLCRVDNETNLTAQFQNLQSMFRQRLVFKNASNETVTPTITTLTVKSGKGKLAVGYYPLYAIQNGFDKINISNPVIDGNGDIYLALRFVGSDGTDALTFTAQDDADNIYELTKAAPSGGFQNGKYYHGTMTLPFVRKVNQPIVTGTSTKPNSYNCYDIHDATSITISGTSTGYRFDLNNGGTITLDNVTATFENTNYFIISRNNLNLVVNGTNSISCPNRAQPITVSGDGHNLMLSGNGTLTVTGKDSSRYGLYAAGNYNGNGLNPNNTDASVLAATGYTVTRSDRTDNGNGTYTWTYTVAPTE